MNANGQLIETLNHSELFQRYEQAFPEATGMPVALRPVQTWQLVFRGKSKENAFCALMAQKNGTCAVCLKFQEQLSLDATDEPVTSTCDYGLCETAVPVKLGLQTIGFLQTGQVLRQKPTDASFQRAVDQARKHGVDIGNEQAKRAYFATPVASPRKLDSVRNLLITFADHLAMKGNQILLQTENAESPIIAKAKQYIREHYTEDLSLAHVASIVHTGSFYFCKLFRKCTAIPFTEFVSRIRVEKAKNLLLNPNLRISEIAFSVGFQSITHFNRMFQRIVRQSPRNYRENLRYRPESKWLAPQPSPLSLKSHRKTLTLVAAIRNPSSSVIMGVLGPAYSAPPADPLDVEAFRASPASGSFD